MAHVRVCATCNKPIDCKTDQYTCTNREYAKARWNLVYAHVDCLGAPPGVADLLKKALDACTDTTRAEILAALAVCDQCGVRLEPGTVLFTDAGRLRHVACNKDAGHGREPARRRRRRRPRTGTAASEVR